MLITPTKREDKLGKGRVKKLITIVKHPRDCMLFV